MPDTPIDEPTPEEEPQVNIVLEEDEPPKGGVWYEHTPLTEAEIEQGNALGHAIDTEDDNSTGLDPS